ncbi:MAG: fibrobacter succinogenes major paralogous domain-containing protein [Bacteroidales bacterium]
MKRKMTLYALCIMSVATLLMSGCKKDNTTTPTPTPATITDINGNLYHTVTIGTQVWLKENLKVTKYRNGESIIKVNDITWGNLTTGAYCYIDNDTNKLKIYGCLYNWFAVMDSRKICPTGWHIPTLAEVNTLKKYLGNNAGGKLKETGLTHWVNINIDATNETGFTALPGGRRDADSYFAFSEYAYWWTSSEYVLDNTKATYFSVWYFVGNLDIISMDKKTGMSIRCIKD